MRDDVTIAAFRRAVAATLGDDTIEGWLLQGPAQLTRGAHAGAIAGTIADDKSPTYVYPEIAGYYLQWLAWRAQRGGAAERLAWRAQAVQRWLRVWQALGDPPATRVHLDGTADDWRNRGVFCFDLAMVVRGLGSAARARLLVPDREVIEGVARQLERLIAADGQFDACRPHRSNDVLPVRWSTRRGAFLAKAAAGILAAADALPELPASIVRAAEATLAASIDALEQSPHREAHPLLYAGEGVLALPRHGGFRDALPIVAARYADLLTHASNDGFLPETLANPASAVPQRVDVLAQALRVGHLLTLHLPRQPLDRVALLRMRHALEHQVHPSGAVAFARGVHSPRWNVWAALFTDQALAFAAPAGAVDASWRTDPLLV